MKRFRTAVVALLGALLLAGCGNIPDPQAKLDQAKERARQHLSSAHDRCVETAKEADEPTDRCDVLAQKAGDRLDQVSTVPSP